MVNPLTGLSTLVSSSLELSDSFVEESEDDLDGAGFLRVKIFFGGSCSADLGVQGVNGCPEEKSL